MTKKAATKKKTTTTTTKTETANVADGVTTHSDEHMKRVVNKAEEQADRETATVNERVDQQEEVEPTEAT